MSEPRNLVLAGMFVILAAGFTTASDIYIAQNAAGGNTGADCADPHAVAWFNSSANWGSGAGKIGPGTTVHLCGTVTSNLTANGSGSSGSPITILFESGAGISLSSCGSTGCLNVAGKSYIVVDGGANGIIEATGSGTGLSTTDSVGIYGRSGISNVEIKNLTINDMYVHSNLNDGSNNNYYAIWFDGSNNLIHNNVIHDTMGGIKAETPSSSNQVYKNTIYNINWGIFFSGSGSTANSITLNQIYGNEIYDFAVWDTTSDAYHHDGIFLTGGDNVGTTTHNDIYNNYIHGNGGSSPNCSSSSGSCMTAYMYINSESYTRMFNNLFVAPTGDQGPNNGWVTIYLSDHDSFYNNTVIGGTTASNSSGNNCTYFASTTNSTVENNVFSNCDTLFWNNGSTFLALDYNTYQRPSALTGAWRIGTSLYNTLAAWRTASGDDASAQAQTASLNLDSNYKPLPTSIVVKAAQNLTTVGVLALDSDRAGVARPGGSTPWDAGSYQDPPISSGPQPPSGLTAQVN